MRISKIFVIIVILLNGTSLLAQKPDTLHTKRAFLSIKVYRDSVELSKRRLTEVYKDTWAPKIKYKWSKILMPIGAVTVVGGAGLTAFAIKGENYITTTEGKQVSYKVISLPQLTIGVGLFVVGCSLMASSNQLLLHSVDVYNSMVKASRKTSYIHKVQFGITQTNTLGFSISLK